MNLKIEDNNNRIKSYEPEIQKIGSTVNQPELYDDLVKSIAKQDSFLFGSDDGIAVLSPIPNGGILIWVAVKNNDIQTPVDWLSYQNDVENLARDIKAKYIEFWSVRAGFSRLVKRLGYTARKDLWNGVAITVWRKDL